MNKNMLEAKDIKKTYKNGAKAIEVLKGVDVSVKTGEFVVIAGPSGAGKSTLLHILSGLDFPDKGTVLIDERDINNLNESALCRMRSRKMGFIFQFYHLLSEFTVLENVLMPVMVRRRAGSVDMNPKDRALQLLEQAGLKERMGHFPSQLSGGEKQRVAICRALINDPEILFCDEPTGNLDSQTGSEIISLIKEINTERRMTVVLVTHNLELIKTADRLYNLKDGILVN